MAQVYRGGRLYGTGRTDRLTAFDVRRRTFTARWRGLDPDEVHAFLLRIADELEPLHREARLLREENDRLKRALRDWQSMHARECRPPEQHHSNERRW
ncbi:DivIVA domain-containing protein [Micromonosporaceae bacterium DT194]|uniref:DivIVA domain-containing protein n=1 Tax=Melissospora conviva TaxID=3388432 RepID=UPI003C1A4E0C